MIPDKIQEKIDYVLDEFDFEKCQKCMTELNWTWTNSIAENGIPTIGEMRRFARRLLLEVYGNKDKEISSGGLVATYKKETENTPEHFLLQFIVEFKFSSPHL